MSAGVELNTIHWGNGPRRILLLHGITASAAGWWRLGPDIAARGWSVTAADLRGHGLSPRTDRFRLSDYAADVLALGTGWDAVLGHSLGGSVTLTAQAEDPTWAKSLVLQDPALTMRGATQDEIMEWLVEPFRPRQTPAEVAAANPRWNPEDVRMKVRSIEQSSEEMVVATVEDIWPWEVVHLLDEIDVPISIIGSDPDHGAIVPQELGEQLAAHHDHVSYRMIARGSHSAHRDEDVYPDLLAAVEEALDQVPSLEDDTARGV